MANEGTKKFQTEFIIQFRTLVISAFGFVAGLALNDAVRSTLDKAFPQKEGVKILVKYAYVAILIIVFVGVIVLFSYLTSRVDREEAEKSLEDEESSINCIVCQRCLEFLKKRDNIIREYCDCMNVGDHGKDHHFIEIDSKTILRGKESLKWVANVFPRKGKKVPSTKRQNPPGILSKPKSPGPSKAIVPHTPRVTQPPISSRRKIVSFFPDLPKDYNKEDVEDDVPRLVRKSTTPSRKLRHAKDRDERRVSNPDTAIQVYRPRLNPSSRRTVFDSLHGTYENRGKSRRRSMMDQLPSEITADQIQQLRKAKDPRLFAYIQDDFQGLADGYGTIPRLEIRSSTHGSMKDHFERAQRKTVADVTEEGMMKAAEGKEMMLKKIYDSMDEQLLQTDRKRRRGVKRIKTQLQLRDE